jgi:hypothetical protein
MDQGLGGGSGEGGEVHGRELATRASLETTPMAVIGVVRDPSGKAMRS